MKKKELRIIIVLIILILCLNTVVYAAIYAYNVKYSKSDGTEIDVEDALNELYEIVPRYEIGDEVTVGGEQFYVLEWGDNSGVALLMAKYNLGAISQGNYMDYEYVSKFSSTNYWSSSFTTSPFTLNNFITFASTDALGRAKSYGISKGAISSRLLTYEEAIALKTKASSNTKIATMLWGKDSVDGYLKYWLGSASTTTYVWVVSGNNISKGTYSYERIWDSSSYNCIKV